MSDHDGLELVITIVWNTQRPNEAQLPAKINAVARWLVVDPSEARQLLNS
ncbi:hypothetical protein AAFX91_37830 [Bradyrhizobium sp. 31Argb]|nr:MULTISPECIES: hypothetical protein [Bradyrhizobium]